MSFFTGLYNLLIGPLELLFEFVYFQAYRLLENPGTAIILLSLIINFLVLPLYKRADEMQEQQRQTEKALNHWTTHIKKTFKGDERYMMLQTYYRENHYKPIHALNGTVSLLLEIPFFIAAYNMLSGMEILQGTVFGPIQDLGQPDGLIQLGSVSINLLPILMTAINLVTSAMFTKGMPLRSKIQLYGMAALFLVLLYDSPSGLVFYWTLNNVFSLVKTIFYKLRNPRKILGILSSVIGLIAIIPAVGAWSSMDTYQKVVSALLLVVLQLPGILYAASAHRSSGKQIQITKKDTAVFFACCIFLAAFTGLLIPSLTLKNSPDEFINGVTLDSPVWYAVNAGVLAFGTFVVWLGVFYHLSSPSGKKAMGLVAVLLSGIAVVDFMLFGTGLGNMSAQLIFDTAPHYLLKEKLLNLLAIAGVSGVLFLIWKFKKDIIKVVTVSLCLASVLLSCVNLNAVKKNTRLSLENLHATADSNIQIPLSRDGKNVFIVMMDRAIGAYVPYIFQEKPELKEKFQGFTYYPNTISYGPSTNFGLPGLFGGYDYLPEKMNERDQELLVDKHNEAMQVLPVLFDRAGYEVTVCDPTLAGYTVIPDLGIYDKYDDINAYITMREENPVTTPDEVAAAKRADPLYRNFFFYSLFKTAPVSLQNVIYSDGLYNNLNAYQHKADQEDLDAVKDDYNQTVESTEGEAAPSDEFSVSVGVSYRFALDYRALQLFPSYFQAEDDSFNTFTMICNETSHEPQLLQKPDYVPAEVVDNREIDAATDPELYTIDGRKMELDTEMSVKHYHCNMAAMLQLGNWLDYLRENGVYDNSRIIIVADHGYLAHSFADMRNDEMWLDTMLFNPTLLVKDFGATEFTTDEQFMTNVDVPCLALNGIVDNPVNPFTGNPITMDKKYEPVQRIFFSTDWNTQINNGCTFMPGTWYALRNQDMRNIQNWSYD